MNRAVLTWGGVTARRMVRHALTERHGGAAGAVGAVGAVEVDLVGYVMEAKATLTIGAVTVGAHA